MSDLITIVRCPKCGSTNAESIEEMLIEFDRMHCYDCEHEEICDEYQIKFDWNERVSPEEARRRFERDTAKRRD